MHQPLLPSHRPMIRRTPRARHAWAASCALLALSAQASASSLADIARDGKLTVLYADAGTPFFGQGAAGPHGFDYDVLKGFATRHGLEVVTVPLPSVGELIPALRAGRGELIAGAFTRTEERAREVLFTGEVTPQRHVVVTLAPKPAVESLEQLRTLRVGTVGGSSWESAAREAGIGADQLDTTLPLDGTAVVNALREGRIDAAVTGLFFALLQRREDPDLRLGLLLGEPGYHAYAVLPGDAELHKALDAYLTSVRDSAGWYRIVIKHFGQDAPDLFRRARGG